MNKEGLNSKKEKKKKSKRVKEQYKRVMLALGVRSNTQPLRCAEGRKGKSRGIGRAHSLGPNCHGMGCLV